MIGMKDEREEAGWIASFEGRAGFFGSVKASGGGSYRFST